MTETYDEILGYDADHTDETQYCQHGTFIGSWWGPDYLCHLCELGVTRREQLLESVSRNRRQLNEMLDRLVKFVLAAAAVQDSYHTDVIREVQPLINELQAALTDRRKYQRELVRDVWHELHGQVETA